MLCVGDHGGAEGEAELALHDYSVQTCMVIDEPTLEAGVCRDTSLDGTAGVLVQVRRNGITISRPGSETNPAAGKWSPELGTTITMVSERCERLVGHLIARARECMDVLQACPRSLQLCFEMAVLH